MGSSLRLGSLLGSFSEGLLYYFGGLTIKKGGPSLGNCPHTSLQDMLKHDRVKPVWRLAELNQDRFCKVPSGLLGMVPVNVCPLV